MQTWSRHTARAGSDQGPPVYLGYCNRSHRYRMMALPEYMLNVQEGFSRLMRDAPAAYRDLYGRAADYAGAATAAAPRQDGCGCGDCGCRDCHCDCCVEDADILTHARCGESRRISVTFENDTRRERPVNLDLGAFVTAGGRDLGWPAQLSETKFTLPPCGAHTVVVSVQVRCGDPKGSAGDEGRKPGTVDRCEVGYATIRATGCTTRPVVVALAVLPDDCDAYEHPCACGCCH